jgi:hypothetical protein
MVMAQLTARTVARRTDSKRSVVCVAAAKAKETVTKTESLIVSTDVRTIPQNTKQRVYVGVGSLKSTPMEMALQTVKTNAIRIPSK